MKLQGFFLLVLVFIFPSRLFSNTLYFPQVAFGGGYTTTFVIVNTGTTPVSSRLNFYSQGGAARTELGTQIDIAAGNSARFTLPDTGPLTVVWGEFNAGEGAVQGVATFDLRDVNGTLITSAGVLGIEGYDRFLLPVDVTPSAATGVAVANTSGSGIEVVLRLIAEDGTPAGAATYPLAAYSQVARFVTETGMFPQLAQTNFKGTLLIEAPAGAPANALSATALMLKEGLLSALPVIAGGAAGASVLDFPQVAFGGGYSTTFTIMNAGSTPVTSQLRFYSQGGAARNDLDRTISIPVGGSARYTIPDQGPLTVVWADLVAIAGTVQGVATFDFRPNSVTLTASAGVLGIQPGNGFIFPVDVTATGATGVAVANATDGGMSLGLRLFDESGGLVATANDRSLAGRGQLANFVTEVFPQLGGSPFKGTLVLSAGTGTLTGSLAATALTVKEGLLSALPVIRDNSGASSCLNPIAYTSAATVHLEYQVSGELTGSVISDVVTTPNVQFEGQTAAELKATQTTTYSGSSPSTVTLSNYSRLDGLDIVTYGNLLLVTTSVGNVTVRSVYSPPLRDKRYALGVGEMASQSYTINSTPPAQNPNRTLIVKYLGRERLTVEAGTFDTCKFELGNGASTTWIAVGAGVSVKSTGTEDGYSIVQELRTGTINGAPISQ